ncbi:MAG: hypothetical protein DCC75_00330 [Proteobacteria bacterium]|nr:MAG: hypothetical protein DCC75_00330 [Pseudomonadota bacterium]
MRKAIFALFIVAQVCLGAPEQSLAQQTFYLPESLKPWLTWVKERNPDLSCAYFSTGPLCTWPGKLSLSLNSESGEFQFFVTADNKQSVRIPGGGEVQPYDVSGLGPDGRIRPLAVTIKGDTPYVELDPGIYQIRGKFAYAKIPPYLSVPHDIGVVELNLQGLNIAFPQVSSKGQLWLRDESKSAEPESDSLRLQVFRRFEDSLPFKITTAISLRIGGRAREVKLPGLVPDGYSITAVNSPLSYIISPDNSLTLQGRQGSFDIKVEALSNTAPKVWEFRGGEMSEWPAQEVIVWKAREELRSVQIEGGTPIDPARTELPSEWRGLPAYFLEAGEKLEFTEIRRGEVERAQNQINLQRKFWLDLDGKGFTVQDNFSGAVNRDWRLNAHPSSDLGRVSISGQDQLITLDPQSGLRGLELRVQNLALSAESRVKADAYEFPAIGWDHDVQSLGITLNLPPGWRILSSKGADQVSESTLGSWTLLDFFIILLVAVGCAKLLSLKWGIIAGAALIFTRQEHLAIVQGWIHLVVALGILSVLKEKDVAENSFTRLIRYYFNATLVLIALLSCAFIVGQIRLGLYPQVTIAQSVGDMLEPFYYLLEYSFGGWALLFFVALFAIQGVLALSSWRIIRGLGYIVLGAVALAILVQFSTITPYPQSATFQQEQFAPAGRAFSKSAQAPAAFMEGYDELSAASEAPESEKDKSEVLERKRQALVKLDPKAIIQTGPGLPNWNWRSVSFNWVGPVSKEQLVRVWLLGPNVNFLLCLLRVVLVISILYAFWNKRPKGERSKLSPAASLLLGVLMFVFIPGAAAQEFPDSELLKELEDRLVSEQCKNDCSTINSMRLRVSAAEVEIDATISAKPGTAPAAVALPGPLSELVPRMVTIDGRETAAMRSDAAGIVWARVEPGVRYLKIKGAIVKPNLLTLQFAQRPAQISVDAQGWEIDGLSDLGAVKNSLQFTRKAGPGQAAVIREPEETAQEAKLASWYVLKRELFLDLPWSVSSKIERLGSVERPAVVKVNLLPGETVNSEHVQVENGKAVITFAREATSVYWDSTLSETPELVLEAKQHEHAQMNEIWKLYCSPIWRCSSSGLAPVSSIISGAKWEEWYPYHGERVSVNVSRPEAAEGRTITVQSLSHHIDPGARLTKGSINLTVRSSQGGYYKLSLPEGAILQAITMNGRNETTRFSGTKLEIPLIPGSNQISVSYELETPQQLLKRIPPMQIQGEAKNAVMSISLADDRWILWAGGLNWGPAVLFWGKLIGVIILALVLARMSGFQIAVGSWILLGIGLATLPIGEAAIPVAWLFAVRYRNSVAGLGKTAFNLLQIGLVIFTFVALAVLYDAIRTGLILRPDMQVFGGGSSDQLLRWYVDTVEANLPSPWALSLPLWAWNGLMLVWSVWLVFALIRWLRWGMEAFGRGGMWRSS